MRFAPALLAAVSICAPPINAEPRWETLADTLVARQEVAVTTDGVRIYLFGGIEGGSSGTAEVYDPELDQWSFIAPLPEALHHSAAVALGGQIFLIGGYGAGSFVPSESVYRYDIAGDTWTKVAPLPQARGAHTAAAINSRIYVTGGVPLDGRLLIYDPIADAWTEGPPLPTPREHLTSAVFGGRMYVVGGRTSSIGSVRTTVEMYDPWLERWEPKASLPTGRAGIAAATLFGRIYVFGGEGNSARNDGIFPQTESYDPILDEWRSEPDMSFPRHGIGAAALGNRIHIPSGAPVAGFALSSHHDVLVVDEPESVPLPRRRSLRRP